MEEEEEKQKKKNKKKKENKEEKNITCKILPYIVKVITLSWWTVNIFTVRTKMSVF